MYNNFTENMSGRNSVANDLCKFVRNSVSALFYYGTLLLLILSSSTTMYVTFLTSLLDVKAILC